MVRDAGVDEHVSRPIFLATPIAILATFAAGRRNAAGADRCLRGQRVPRQAARARRAKRQFGDKDHSSSDAKRSSRAWAAKRLPVSDAGTAVGSPATRWSAPLGRPPRRPHLPVHRGDRRATRTASHRRFLFGRIPAAQDEARSEANAEFANVRATLVIYNGPRWGDAHGSSPRTGTPAAAWSGDQQMHEKPTAAPGRGAPLCGRRAQGEIVLGGTPSADGGQ